MEALPLNPSSETLLIVDDEPLMTELFRQFMTKRGFHVLTAQSGREALSLLESHRGSVDLVISDMALPQMDGVDIAKAVEIEFPCLPVIIATGHDKSATQAGLPSNVVGVIQKPYQNRMLADYIRDILDSRKIANRADLPAV